MIEKIDIFINQSFFTILGDVLTILVILGLIYSLYLLGKGIIQFLCRVGHRLSPGKTLSIRDPLTGAYNRRYILQQLNEISAEDSKHRQKFCISFLDIDRLREVVDFYGEAVSDLVLKEFSLIVNSAISQNDHFGRVGGDEFIIVFTNSTKHEAVKKMEEIMATIRLTTFSYYDQKVNITFSCGVLDSSEIPQGIISGDKTIAYADNRLFVAKKRDGGKDRCFSSENEW